MDDRVFRRLDCLSKKQLLAAIRVMTDGLDTDAAAVSSLVTYLDSIEPAPGSNRKVPVADNSEVVDATAHKVTDPGFEMSKYRTRQVAFQIQYDGSKYLGFASQDLAETVENHLFNAFTKLKLIEDRKTCKYSRCGRTDKGVSALGQVISLNVRSAIPKCLPEELVLQLAHPLDKVVLPANAAVGGGTTDSVSTDGGATTADTAAVSTAQGKNRKPNKSTAASTPTAPKDKVIQEMDYVSMLNRALPDEIRVLGWSPVTDDFSARFSASHRTYRYFFLRGGLDVAAMQQAAQLLVGEHDFRNLCKLDIGNVTNFRREVYYAKIVPFRFTSSTTGTTRIRSGMDSESNDDGADSTEAGGPDAVYMLEISGIAFLWHMVRAIMAVLFMVGEGLEAPSVVAALLDVVACPGKPPYTLADELPLVLHECGFDRLVIPAQPRHLWQLTAHYRAIREGHLLAAARAQNSLEHLVGKPVRVGDVREFAEGLRQQQARHSRNLQGARAGGANASNGGSGGSGASTNPHKRRKVEPLEQPSSGTTAVGAEDSTSAEVNAMAGAAGTNEPTAALWEKQDTTAVDVDQQVQWCAVMHRVEGQLGYTPQVKYVPHVPLMQRKKEATYEEKVKQLAGNKRERLDRHLTLSSAAAETGATSEFFQKMRAQGSVQL